MLRHYPRLLCDRCYSTEAAWHEASGRGRIHSWTVAHHAFHPAFAADLPYTLLTVDLEAGVRALGRWRGDGVPAIRDPVQGRCVPREGGVDLVFEAGRPLNPRQPEPGRTRGETGCGVNIYSAV